MRTVQVVRFGGPEVLVMTEMPDPVPGPGEALIDVVAADTLFVETQIRKGLLGEYFKVKPPYVPGFGVVGAVRLVAEDVEPAWLGRNVVALAASGGYAERMIASAKELVPVPDGLDLQEAAALLSDGPVAMALAEQAQIGSGQWVLVVAAGGGLGTLLVQIARTAGAKVIAAARGKRKLDLARELGADVVVDYSTAGWVERVLVATAGKGAGIVFDGAGGKIGREAFEVTAHGGQFSAHGTPSGAFAAISPAEAEQRGIHVRGIQHVQLAPETRIRLIERVMSEAVAGRIHPVIGQTFPLEHAAEAHAVMEAREAIGKTLLLVC